MFSTKKVFLIKVVFRFVYRSLFNIVDMWEWWVAWYSECDC